MTELTLEAVRMLMREELAPIRAAIGNLESRLDAMRPNIDGIPLLQQAVRVLQQEMRMQRDETRVLGAVVMRLDTSTASFAEQMRATHSQMTQLWTRVRTLEGEEPIMPSPPG
jgi:hypothetical protein